MADVDDREPGVDHGKADIEKRISNGVEDAKAWSMSTDPLRKFGKVDSPVMLFKKSQERRRERDIPQIPENAIAYYNFSWSTLEQVNKQSSLTTVSDAKNVIRVTDDFDTNGTIKTVPAGEAALNGDGVGLDGTSVLIEGIGAEQLLPEPLDFSDAQWGKIGTTTISNGYADPNGGTEAYLIDNIEDASGQRLTDTVESGMSVDGRTFVGSIYFKADGNAGDVVSFQIKRAVGGPPNGTTENHILTDEFVRIDTVFTGETDNEGVSISIINDATSTANKAIIYCGNVVEAPYVSSPIFIQGVRAEDDSKIPTTGFSSTNFTITTKGTMKTDYDDHATSTLYESSFNDVSARLRALRSGSTGNLFCETRTADGMFALNDLGFASIGNGDSFTHILTYDGVNLTSQINGGTVYSVAATGTLTWESVLHLLINKAGASGDNAEIESILIE